MAFCEKGLDIEAAVLTINLNLLHDAGSHPKIKVQGQDGGAELTGNFGTGFCKAYLYNNMG